MRSMLKGALVALMAALALGAVAAASASAALPEVTIVGGGAYPISLESSQTLRAKISEAIEAHDCSGVGSKGSIAGSGKAMSLTLELEHCKTEKGTECSTEGAEVGHEVLSGSATLVYIDKAKGEVGVLDTLNAATISCGSAHEKVQGSVLARVSPLNTQASELELLSTGNGAGTPTYRTYENEKGELETAKLEVNYGAGYKESALEAEGEVKSVVQDGKKLEILTETAPPPEGMQFLLGEGGSFPDALSYSSSTAVVRITDPVETLTCEGIAASGSVTGAQAVALTLNLDRCQNEKSKECNSGVEAGVITLSGSGDPVYIDKSEKLAGLLQTVTAPEIRCGSEKVKVRGSIVDPLTPVGTRTSTLDLSLQGNGKGKPTYTSYENEKGEVEKVKLETNFGSGYKESALEAISEYLELNASEAVTLDA